MIPQITGFSDQTKATQAVMKARTGMIINQVFFSSLALKLKLMEDPFCPTAWTDGRCIGYNPKFVEGLTMDTLKGLWAHEVMHIALLHHLREGARNHRKWNRACDYAINLILKDSGFQLPTGALMDGAFAVMSAEAIYDKLPDDPGDKGGGQGDGQGKGQGGDPGQGQSQAGQWGEVRKATNPDTGKELTPAEVEEAEARMKVDVIQAANNARARGQLPGSLDRAIGEVVSPKVNWRELLQHFVDRAARNDYSWRRPNRAYIQRGFYVPALYSQELPECAILVDTSGSISGKELDQFAAEISGILAEYNTLCHVIYVDARMQSHEEFSRDDLPLFLHPKGGGGTDFRPGFKWMEDEGIDPRFAVYLTDLCCNQYPTEPEYPVLWGKIGTSVRRSASGHLSGAGGDAGGAGV